MLSELSVSCPKSEEFQVWKCVKRMTQYIFLLNVVRFLVKLDFYVFCVLNLWKNNYLLIRLNIQPQWLLLILLSEQMFDFKAWWSIASGLFIVENTVTFCNKYFKFFVKALQNYTGKKHFFLIFQQQVLKIRRTHTIA